MSVELTYPGVYVEELPSGVHTITGVATSIAAFIGWAPKGPVDHATLVESWPEFHSTFGGLYPGAYLGYAVNQFFANGGRQAYIIRLAWNVNVPTVTSPAPVAAATASVANVGGSMTLYASSPGEWANTLQVRLVPKSGSNTRFSLQVIDAANGNVLESFDNLSVVQSDPLYMVTVVDADSQNVTFVNPLSPQAAITPPTSIAASTIAAPTGLTVGTSPGGALPPSTTYYYKITAIYPDGESAESLEASAATSATNNLTLHLSWTAAADFNGKAPTGYRILRGAAAGAENAYFTIAGTATTFDDDGTEAPIGTNAIPMPTGLTVASQNGGGLPPSTTYYYTVKAIFPDGESAESLEASAATTATNLKLHLSWTAAANFKGNAATGYRILRGAAAGAENEYFVAGTATSFDDDGSVVPTPWSAKPMPSAPLQLSGGQDGALLMPASSDFDNALLNDPSGLGLSLLDPVPIFNLLCVPGETNPATVQTLQDYCATNRAFCIVDSEQTATVDHLRTNGPAGLTNAPNAANSALYFPWISAPDPLAGNRPTLMPPCGFVAGIYAKTDAARGVWKAPSGLDAGLTGALGLQYTLTDLENGDLNIQGINCLREFRIYGDVVWGARTLLGANEIGSPWKYVPIRRLALFLESSLYEGTQWVVFEPNDERLWSQIRLNVGAFMQDLFLQGAFQGTTPQKAYFVKCDAENNPQSSIDQGVVNILVGFMPLYPAEFVVIRIQQMMASQS